MYTIAIVGQKGGTGKSTIATHLAVCAARDGKAVALFDIDPQASAAKWSARRTAEGPPVVRAGAAQLPNLLQQAREQGADLILIDTAGHADASSIHALQLADLVLIPCRPSAADLDDIETLPALRDLLRVAGDKPAMVIVTNAPIQGSRHIHAQEAARDLGFMICPVVLFHRAAVYDSPLPGLGVQEYEPEGKAAQEITQLYKFTTELLHNHIGVQDDKTKPFASRT